MGFWSFFIMGLTPVLVGQFLESIPNVIREFSKADRTRDMVESYIWESISPTENVFDFIIVGAGSSGSLLANRLSKDFRVLVLEAGGQPNPLMNIPGIAPLMINKPETDWMYKTVPQERACKGLVNQSSNWPRGKMEGGTSNINALIYLRGHPQDYDNWANITGNPIWSYENLIPIFKKFENFVDNEDSSKGHSGELVIEELEAAQGQLQDFFVQAGIKSGFPKADLNGNYTQGFDKFKFTKKNGQRWEGYSAFLSPAKASDGHDITVYKYAHVTRVLLDRKKRAIGVEYIRHGLTLKAKATNEIILCAGAVNTPQLLMLSGIGPKNHLKNKGIRVKVNRPGVGKNLQDHVGTYTGVFTLKQPLTFSVERDFSPEIIFEYFTEGTGPLSSVGVQAVGQIATKYEIENSKAEGRPIWPDVQLSLIGHSIPENFQLVAEEENIKQDLLERFWGAHRSKDAFHIFVFQTRPQGTGEILLHDKNPLSRPIINPRYLENELDARVIVEGMKKAVEIIEKSELFQEIGAELSPIPLDECSHFEFRSDLYWDCYLRQLTLTIYHPSSTCSMGRHDNPNAVVDSELRVIGVEGLRIADVSVAPKIITSNINGACNVIAEVAADLIKKKWMK